MFVKTFSALQCCRSLTKLNLDGNRLGQGGASALMTAVRKRNAGATSIADPGGGSETRYAVHFTVMHKVPPSQYARACICSACSR